MSLPCVIKRSLTACLLALRCPWLVPPQCPSLPPRGTDVPWTVSSALAALRGLLLPFRLSLRAAVTTQRIQQQRVGDGWRAVVCERVLALLLY